LAIPLASGRRDEPETFDRQKQVSKKATCAGEPAAEAWKANPMTRNTLGAITFGVTLVFLAAFALVLVVGPRAAAAARRQQAAIRAATDKAANAARAEAAAKPDARKQDATKGIKRMTEKATFGAGCFWGVEATFQQTPGVITAVSGYAGGTLENPTYQDVCTGRTGHAEVVEVTYDPAKVRYEDLLKVFFENHNPTTLNRQGPDVGTQYRSAVFFHSPEQQAAAEKMKTELDKSGVFKKPITTEVTPASTFYKAEEYHQKYLEKRGLTSCHL